jgi:hypothetical protein
MVGRGEGSTDHRPLQRLHADVFVDFRLLFSVYGP